MASFAAVGDLVFTSKERFVANVSGPFHALITDLDRATGQMIAAS